MTYAYDGTQGSITRTVRNAGAVTDTRIVARGLELAYLGVFEYCAPISLTMTPAITPGGSAQTIAVSNTTNVRVGSELSVDTGAAAETVVVTGFVANASITAVFAKAHSAATPATNACLSLNVTVPYRFQGTLVVRTISAALHPRAS